ncbi:MAG: DNA repair protein RadA, partial [Holophagales bacterium]|nr:DNA repair protein RadA [Holophagales bacterium]
FLNVVGGLLVKEPAADLAVAAAVLSAEREQPLPRSTAFFGEVGLLGEVRPVSRTDSRLKEVAQLGFRRVVSPSLEGVRLPRGLEVVEIADLHELPGRLFGQG